MCLMRCVLCRYVASAVYIVCACFSGGLSMCGIEMGTLGVSAI
jgi:hypothetical protein